MRSYQQRPETRSRMRADLIQRPEIKSRIRDDQNKIEINPRLRVDPQRPDFNYFRSSITDKVRRFTKKNS